MNGLAAIASGPVIGPVTPAGPHRAGHDHSARSGEPESGPHAPASPDSRSPAFGLSRAGLIDGASVVAAQETNGEQDERGDTDKQGPTAISDEERREVAEMRARDAEVRAHESAHKAAGGAYAGAVSLTYLRGPDGKRYAVAGEVPIDAAPVDGDPRATIAKLTQVKGAALAPANPSGPDRAIAAAATAGILKAQSELAAQRAEGTDQSEGADRTIELIPPGQAPVGANTQPDSQRPSLSFTV